MRILLVDDEADLLDAVARGLRREGYAVDTAMDGAEALAKAEAEWLALGEQIESLEDA